MRFITINEYDFALIDSECIGLSAKHISKFIMNKNVYKMLI